MVVLNKKRPSVIFLILFSYTREKKIYKYDKSNPLFASLFFGHCIVDVFLTYFYYHTVQV